MQVMTAVQGDIISLFLIWVILFYGKIQERNWRERHLFNWLLLINVILSVSDMLAWTLEGAAFPGAYWVLQISTLLYNLSIIFTGGLWLIYCDQEVIENRADAKKRISLYMLPLFFVILLNIINVKTGWIFYYDSANMYHRGELYFLQILIAVAYLMTTAGIVIVAAGGKERSKARAAYGLLGFLVTPILTVVVQSLYYGVSLIPFGVTISLLMIFLQQVKSLITRDHLTGLDNQRAFERRLEDKVRNAVGTEEKLFVMMIDANHFKDINDTYGHDIGDEALVRIARCLCRACAQSDYIARLGGDEFVVIGYRADEERIRELADRIHAEMKKESKLTDYVLSVSLGYEIFQYRKHKSGAELYKQADKKMYENKRQYHKEHD